MGSNALSFTTICTTARERKLLAANVTKAQQIGLWRIVDVEQTTWDGANSVENEVRNMSDRTVSGLQK